MPQCQADKTFTVPENEAVLPWDGMQGLMGSPDHDDHSLAELGLGQNKIQALTVHGTYSCGPERVQEQILPTHWLPRLFSL